MIFNVIKFYQSCGFEIKVLVPEKKSIRLTLSAAA